MANLQVPQGGCATAYNVNNQITTPKNSPAWKIENASQSVIASSDVPNGWNVTITGLPLDYTVTVCAPAAAAIDTGNYAYIFTPGFIIYQLVMFDVVGVVKKPPPAIPSSSGFFLRNSS